MNLLQHLKSFLNAVTESKKIKHVQKNHNTSFNSLAAEFSFHANYPFVRYWFKFSTYQPVLHLISNFKRGILRLDINVRRFSSCFS